MRFSPKLFTLSSMAAVDALVVATNVGGVEALPMNEGKSFPTTKATASIDPDPASYLEEALRSRLLHNAQDIEHVINDEPKCGEVLGKITTSEITQIMNMFLNMLQTDHAQKSYTTTKKENPSLIESAIEALLSIIEYDVMAIKVCTSCEEIWEHYAELGLTVEELTNSNKFGFSTYCSPDSHAYNAQHSALIFAPIDPFSNDEIFENAVLKVVMTGRSDRVNLHDAPTSSWPLRSDSLQNITQMFHNDDQPTWTTNVQMAYLFRSSIVPLMSSASGSLAIMPDFLGFGETSTKYQRPFITPLPYQQSFVVSYFATMAYFDKLNKEKNEKYQSLINGIDDKSREPLVDSQPSCTLVDKVVSVTGYSEGGYGALVGSLALEQVGIRVTSTHLGGAPLHLDRQTGFTFGTWDTHTSNKLLHFFRSMSFSFCPFLSPIPF